MVRRHLTPCLLCLIAPGAVSQHPTLDERGLISPWDCGSVVVIKCDRRAPAGVARQQSNRQLSPVQELEGVVIEADAIRRRTIEDTMGGAFPVLRSRDGNYTFPAGEGAQCTCMNVCPPLPLPCCNCSAQMSRYRLMPGSSPLN